MFERKPNVTNVEIHHDLGVDLNYQAYMLGNPVKMGRPGQSESGNKAEGGPFVPAEFKNRRPEGDRPDSTDSRPEKGRPPKKRWCTSWNGW